MYIDKKVTIWMRDYYDDSKVSLNELIQDPSTDKGFNEREVLFETEEECCVDDIPVFEVFCDDNELLYKSNP